MGKARFPAWAIGAKPTLVLCDVLDLGSYQGRDCTTMRQTTTLLDMARNLLELDRELTIYAAEPWTPNSAAILAEQEGDRAHSAAAAAKGMAYFIEVFIAQDFLDTWIKEKKPSAEEICKNLIYCALDEWP